MKIYLYGTSLKISIFIYICIVYDEYLLTVLYCIKDLYIYIKKNYFCMYVHVKLYDYYTEEIFI